MPSETFKFYLWVTTQPTSFWTAFERANNWASHFIFNYFCPSDFPTMSFAFATFALNFDFRFCCFCSITILCSQFLNHLLLWPIFLLSVFVYFYYLQFVNLKWHRILRTIEKVLLCAAIESHHRLSFYPAVILLHLCDLSIHRFA